MGPFVQLKLRQKANTRSVYQQQFDEAAEPRLAPSCGRQILRFHPSMTPSPVANLLVYPSNVPVLPAETKWNIKYIVLLLKIKYLKKLAQPQSQHFNFSRLGVVNGNNGFYFMQYVQRGFSRDQLDT